MTDHIRFEGDTLTPKEIPFPTGYHLILGPIRIEEQTQGGIIITQTDQKLAETVRFVSKVLAVGPTAYCHDKFKAHPNATPQPWCKVGDIVTTGQYAGSYIPCRTDNESYSLRLVNDDEILSVIPDINVLDV